MSYIEIYQDEIRDLLAGGEAGPAIAVRESAARGTFLENVLCARPPRAPLCTGPLHQAPQGGGCMAPQHSREGHAVPGDGGARRARGLAGRRRGQAWRVRCLAQRPARAQGGGGAQRRGRHAAAGGRQRAPRCGRAQPQRQQLPLVRPAPPPPSARSPACRPPARLRAGAPTAGRARRRHAICTLQLEQRRKPSASASPGRHRFLRSKLHLVDLAGAPCPAAPRAAAGAAAAWQRAVRAARVSWAVQGAAPPGLAAACCLPGHARSGTSGPGCARRRLRQGLRRAPQGGGP